MPAFAANLTMQYGEHAFLDRFAAAAADGFKGVEILFPYDAPAGEIRDRLRDHDLTLALFNAPPGDWKAGERGMASIPGREDEFRRSIDLALSYASQLGNSRLHVMAGLTVPGADPARLRATYVANVAHAARQAAAHGITVVIEPINSRDMPGYFISRQEEGAALCREIGEGAELQFDLYHAQIMQGDLMVRLRALIGQVGHVQVAGVPDRHEPDEGEVNYPALFALLDELAYPGWVGCEYRPRASTSAGLGWMAPWRGRGAVEP